MTSACRISRLYLQSTAQGLWGVMERRTRVCLTYHFIDNPKYDGDGAENKWELADMLRFAIQYPGPVAVRYPRGTAYTGLEEFRAPIEYGKSEVIQAGEGIVLLSVGHMMETALQVSDSLRESGIQSTLVNSRFVKPVDENFWRNFLSHIHFT